MAELVQGLDHSKLVFFGTVRIARCRRMVGRSETSPGPVGCDCTLQFSSLQPAHFPVWNIGAGGPRRSPIIAIGECGFYLEGNKRLSLGRVCRLARRIRCI